MLEKTFVKHCLKSPFFIWSVVLVGITTFDSIFIANIIMQTIVVHQLHIPILFASLTIAFIFSLYPIRRSLIEFSKKKENRVMAITYAVLIFLIFYTEVVYFLSDPFIIFGNLFSETITDKETFDIIDKTKILIQIVILPLFAAINFTNIKSKLLNQGYVINDRIGNNIGFIVYIIIINVIMYVITTLLTNYQPKF